MWYGVEDGLTAWHAICHVIGVDPLPWTRPNWELPAARMLKHRQGRHRLEGSLRTDAAIVGGRERARGCKQQERGGSQAAAVALSITYILT
jgi:hypothetical protein